MKRFVSGFGVAAVLVTGAASADIAGSEPLFRKGRLVLDVVGADVPLGQTKGAYQGNVGPLVLTSTHFASGGGSNRTTSTTSTYGIDPSLDYFVTDHLSIGGRIGLEWTSSQLYDTSVTIGLTHSSFRGPKVEIAPRVGYAIPISATFAFWPRVSGGLFLAHYNARGNDVDSDLYGEFVEGNFSLVARLAPHILLELGPVINYRAESTNGGFFGLVSGASSVDTELDLVAHTSFRVDF